jgi:hypothetical protein
MCLQMPDGGRHFTPRTRQKSKLTDREKEVLVEPIEFIFDYQDGQMTAVIDSWEKLREVVPVEVAEMIKNPPKFQRSTAVPALQAADLSVGWSREQADAKWLNQEIRPVPWGDTGDQLQCLSRYWTREMLSELRSLSPKVKSMAD